MKREGEKKDCFYLSHMLN